jgi:hypothetical protein
LDYLRGFQEDIVEKQYSKEELATKLFANLETIEKVATEMFRLFSNLAHGTDMDIMVDPYTMSLTGEKRESKNSKLLGRDAYLAGELSKMWMYPYPSEVTA